MSGPASQARLQHLEWPGAFNIRDLGGLPTIDGRMTRYRSLIRADDPARLSGEGWSALEGHGIRTIVDLRDESEMTRQMRVTGIRVIRIPSSTYPTPSSGMTTGPPRHGICIERCCGAGPMHSRRP
jgi:hypothetical protein